MAKAQRVILSYPPSQAKKIIKTQVSTRVESIEAVRIEQREPWKLPDSIFKPRSDSS